MTAAIPTENPIDMLVEVRRSPIHGLGLFAKTDIPAGTVWWRAAPGDAMLIKRGQYEALIHSEPSPVSDGLIHAIRTYSYYSEPHDALVLILDNARYTNHSNSPNSGTVAAPDILASAALRDIRAGEEILEDYGTYGDCPWADLYENLSE